jgi:RimJ/RimL family protein N-acetyltransferase
MKPEVFLRDVEPDDLPILFEHQRDPIAVAMVVFKSRERAEFDAHWAKVLANDECLKKTIVADGQVAGHIGSFGRDGKREVGYWIDRALWGRGIMSQALPAFLRIEQQRPLYAGVAPHNAASIRVLEKCGFTPLPQPSAKNSQPSSMEPELADGTHILFVLAES